jgi:PPK2 family polyphosphate:nucleotide phosphotransferase
MDETAFKVPEGTGQFRLDDLDPEFTAGLERDEAEKRLEEIGLELGRMQELLYAAGQQSLLIILQGMDTSGKDGTIKKVLSEIEPQGCRVESFKVPTEEELAHDFLWRVHKVTPRRGMIAVFNRSHYEDVIAVRVNKLAPSEVWSKRYDLINDFEKLLVENGTIIVKFYLHISRDEQQRRLEAREQDVEKAWKLSVGDWKQRQLWSDYIKAYDDALSRCSTRNAPWYVVPANNKWFRNLSVASTIVETLRPYSQRWLEYLAGLASEKLKELEAMRTEPSGQ